MDSLTKFQPSTLANQMNELETRQAALREELRQIDAKMKALKRVGALTESLTTLLEEVAREIAEEAPEELESFYQTIVAALELQKNSHYRKQLDLLDIKLEEINPEQSLVIPTPTWTLDELPITGLGDSSTPNSSVAVDENAPTNTAGKLDKAFSHHDGEIEELNVGSGAEPSVTADKPFAEFVSLSNRVGYQRRVSDGEILCAYLGGKNKSLLEVWGRCVRSESGERCNFELREAKRLKDVKYELKFTGVSFATLESLTHIDTAKSPKFKAADNKTPRNDGLVEYGDTETDLPVEIPMLNIGDRVLIATDRQGSSLVGQVGVVTAGSGKGGAINVGGQLKWFLNEEVNMIERACPRDPAEDLAPSRPQPLDLTASQVPW